MARLSAIASIAVLGSAALGSALAAAGCSNVLGLKDPTFNDTGHDAAMLPIDASPIDMGPGACVESACQFGCDPDTNMCRPAKLWVFVTGGQFLGNGIGGRAGADAKCLTAATQLPTNRACPAARTHAVITLDAGDAIADMVGKFMIPTTVTGTSTLVPVQRADDDIKVANSWNDLVTPNEAPLTDVASATAAPSDAASVVWSGFSSASNCVSWSSANATDNGAFGRTRAASPPQTWLSQATDSCNHLHHLLCICWSGGN
jgi:hypothetical protein